MMPTERMTRSPGCATMGSCGSALEINASGTRSCASWVLEAWGRSTRHAFVVIKRVSR